MKLKNMLKNFFNIDETDKLLLTSEERKNFQKANSINPNELKAALEKAYQAEWLYTYRKQGGRYMGIKEEDLKGIIIFVGKSAAGERYRGEIVSENSSKC